MTEEAAGNGQIDPAILAQMQAALAAVALPPLAPGLSRADIDEEFADVYAEIRTIRLDRRTERKHRQQREMHLRALILANEDLEEQKQALEAEVASLQEQIASGKSEPPASETDAAGGEGAAAAERDGGVEEMTDAALARPDPMGRGDDEGAAAGPPIQPSRPRPEKPRILKNGT